MSCSELTIIRLELSSRLLVPHALAFRVIISFVSQVIIFLAEVIEKMTSEKSFGINQESVVMK